MTRTRPPRQPRKLLLACVSIAVVMLTAFLLNTGEPWVYGLAVLVGMPAIIAYVVALAAYRPKDEGWVLMPAVLIAVLSIFPAYAGGHSVWLSVFGEVRHCTFGTKLDCAGRGAEVDMVVDRLRFVVPLEADQVSLGLNLLLLAGVLGNAAFVLLVARLPARQPRALDVPAPQQNHPGGHRDQY